jgi:hypothetical protein
VTYRARIGRVVIECETPEQLDVIVQRYAFAQPAKCTCDPQTLAHVPGCPATLAEKLCSACDGTGERKGHPVCPNCKGSGLA